MDKENMLLSGAQAEPQSAAEPAAADDAAPGEEPGAEPYLLHVGLYAFRMEVLARFTRFAPSPLETREKLEQLRLLENGIPMRVSLTRHRSIGVDRPEDMAVVGFESFEAQRWLTIGQDHLQQGFMALTRAVARPTTF